MAALRFGWLFLPALLTGGACCAGPALLAWVGLGGVGLTLAAPVPHWILAALAAGLFLLAAWGKPRRRPADVPGEEGPRA
ncbi:MAG: hypothetical protein M0031_11280 [Thermaerobacter sp.]|nr:hypothetical protein [Thermaerobacter sp.]